MTRAKYKIISPYGEEFFLEQLTYKSGLMRFFRESRHSVNKNLDSLVMDEKLQEHANNRKFTIKETLTILKELAGIEFDYQTGKIKYNY